jgi:hypothetical protein
MSHPMIATRTLTWEQRDKRKEKMGPWVIAIWAACVTQAAECVIMQISFI